MDKGKADRAGMVFLEEGNDSEEARKIRLLLCLRIGKRCSAKIRRLVWPGRNRIGCMSIDFPRAWQICQSVPDEKHHPKCSWVRHRMLCDCDVVMKHPETLDDILQGLNGMPCKKYQYDIIEFKDYAFVLFEKLKDFWAQPLDGCWPLKPCWVPNLEKLPKHIKSRQNPILKVDRFRRFTFDEFCQILELRREKTIQNLSR